MECLVSDHTVTSGSNSSNPNRGRTLAFVVVISKSFESQFFYANMKSLSCT